MPKLSSLTIAGFLLGSTGLAHAQEPSHTQVSHSGTTNEIQVERQVIHGRSQRPYMVFTVRKRPFVFEVGTLRYSWQPSTKRKSYDR